MPNIKGGKNYKKGKTGKGKILGKKVMTPWADEDGLTYALVKKKLGGNRLDVDCNDGIQRQAIIPGSFLKRVWMKPNDLVLLQLNSLNMKEGYILFKYTTDDVRYLKQCGELNFDIKEETQNEVKFGDDNSDLLDSDEEQDKLEEIINNELSKKEEVQDQDLDELVFEEI